MSVSSSQEAPAAAVQAVIAAVDGSYVKSGAVVREFLTHQYTLSQKQINSIIAACTVNRGDKDVNEFVQKYEIVRPNSTFNQLQGNNDSCITLLLKKYEPEIRQAPADLLLRFFQAFEWDFQDKVKGFSTLMQMLPVVEGLDAKDFQKVGREIIIQWTLNRSSRDLAKKRPDDGASSSGNVPSANIPSIPSSASSLPPQQHTSPEASVKKRDFSVALDDEKDGYDELITRLKAKHVSIVTGSGVSMAIANAAHSTIMGWEGLLQALARSVQAFTQKPNAWFDETFGHVAPPPGQQHLSAFQQGQRIKDAITALETEMNPGAAVDYTRFVYPLYSAVRASAEATSGSHESLAEAIRALQSPIGTTNYDMLLEECLHRHEVNLLVHQPKDYQHIDAGHEKAIYHLHGVWCDQQGFVLTQSEYLQHAPQFVGAMLHLLDEFPNPADHCRSMLFIGCGEGLFDPHYLLLFRLLAVAHPNVLHYALVSGDAAQFRSKVTEMGITNLRVLSYGAHHSHLRPYLWRLALSNGFQKTEILRLRSGYRWVPEIPAVDANPAMGVVGTPRIVAHAAGTFESAELQTIGHADAPPDGYPICTTRQQLTEAQAQGIYEGFVGANIPPASYAAPNSVWQSVRVTNGETRVSSSLRPK